MKKILVPIDNSRISKSAALYAIGLAEKVKAQIILLSVINASETQNTLLNWRKLLDQMIEKEDQDVSRMIQEIKAETRTTVKITHRYVLGFPVEEMVARFAGDNGINLIVMGTNGATGLKKILGTNTASVIDSSPVPVIAVPRDVEAPKIKKIVYATDMAHLDEEIKTVAQFAKTFDAGIEILYVTGENTKKRSRKELEAILIRMAKYKKIRFNTIEGEDVAKGVGAFVMKHKADLLAMFTHKLDTFEKLFGKSITRKLAFHASVPLLAINKTNS